MFAAITALCFAALATAQSTGFTQSYCSSQNTGSGSPCTWPRCLDSLVVTLILCVLVFWTYQTNGKCTDHCKESGTWAFAVIQYNNCWCSNYIPSTTTDITDCQKDCPGFPNEKCGDKDAGLYIYIEMAGQPSGTAGGSQPSSISVSSATAAPSTDSPSSSDADTVSSSIFRCQFLLHLASPFLLCSSLFTLSTTRHLVSLGATGYEQHLTVGSPRLSQVRGPQVVVGLL